MIEPINLDPRMKMPPVRRSACGSAPGYNRHRENHEYPCQDCTRAWRRYAADYRVRTNRVHKRQVDLPTLAWLLCGPDADVVRRAIGDDYADAILKYMKPDRPDGAS